MLAAIVNVEHLVETAGYPLLFLVVMAETAGLPVPGETGLITAGILASSGKLQNRARDRDRCRRRRSSATTSAT